MAPKRPPDDGEQAREQPLRKRSKSWFLKVFVPDEYKSILSDRLLLDVNRVEFIRHNNNTNRYLYQLCAILLDFKVTEISLCHHSTKSDGDVEWVDIEYDEQEIQSGE